MKVRVQYSKRTRHNESNTRLWVIWRDMLSRCFNTNHRHYQDYGGRGITVCERWKNYLNFKHDMEPSYKPELTLDRVDNDKGYNPNNCRWSTPFMQARNKRSNVWCETSSGPMIQTDLAALLNVTSTCIRLQRKRGINYWLLPVDSIKRDGGYV